MRGAAVLLMSEEKARALGLKPLAAVVSWAYVGVDPADQLLMGPALAMPKALDRAGLALEDVDLVDMHEAFAAQVLSVTPRMLKSAFVNGARLGKRSRRGGDRSGALQRARRVAGAGAPIRRDRRADGDDHGQRARANGEADGAPRDLRGGWAGGCGRSGESGELTNE